MNSDNTDTTNDTGSSPVPREAHQRAEGANDSLFGGMLFTYLRAQAIADGVLVDVTPVAREAGFRIPVAMTRAVWADCVEWAETDSRRQVPQDEAGRLWDVVWMCLVAARRAPSATCVMAPLYRVPRGGRGRHPQRTTLKVICGPGDDGEPVITILLPHED